MAFSVENDVANRPYILKTCDDDDNDDDDDVDDDDDDDNDDDDHDDDDDDDIYRQREKLFLINHSLYGMNYYYYLIKDSRHVKAFQLKYFCSNVGLLALIY